MKWRGVMLLLGLAVAIALTACEATSPSAAPAGGEARAGDLAISGAWVAAASAGAMSIGTETSGMSKPSMGAAMTTTAAYMTVSNRGKTGDRLIAAKCDAATAVEIHTVEKRGDVMAMRPVDGVEVPPGGSARLEPGGYHIMMIGLTRDLTAGGKIDLTLRFETAGEVTVAAEIRDR